MELFSIFQKNSNAELRFRGEWLPSSNSLPDNNKYPKGSVLIAGDTGTINTVTYKEGSYVIRIENTWAVLSDNSREIQLVPSQPNIDLDLYTGIVNSNLVFQIIYINSTHIGTATNTPIPLPGVCEVYGDLDVQRYTTIDNRIFTRVNNGVWQELLDNINQKFNLLQDSISNTYSISSIVSVLP